MITIYGEKHNGIMDISSVRDLEERAKAGEFILFREGAVYQRYLEGRMNDDNIIAIEDSAIFLLAMTLAYGIDPLINQDQKKLKIFLKMLFQIHAVWANLKTDAEAQVFFVLFNKDFFLDLVVSGFDWGDLDDNFMGRVMSDEDSWLELFIEIAENLRVLILKADYSANVKSIINLRLGNDPWKDLLNKIRLKEGAAKDVVSLVLPILIDLRNQIFLERIDLFFNKFPGRAIAFVVGERHLSDLEDKISNEFPHLKEKIAILDRTARFGNFKEIDQLILSMVRFMANPPIENLLSATTTANMLNELSATHDQLQTSTAASPSTTTRTKASTAQNSSTSSNTTTTSASTSSTTRVAADKVSTGSSSSTSTTEKAAEKTNFSPNK